MNRQDFLYEFADFCLNPNERLLSRNGTPLPLTPKAFDTLVALVENSGHMVEKEELMKRLWPDAVVEDANLAVNVSVLRKALGESASLRFIETVPRHGYRFVAPVRRMPVQAAIILEEHTKSRLIIEDEVDDGAQETTSTVRPKSTRPRRGLIAAVSVLVVTTAAAFIYSWTNHTRRVAVVSTPKSIAVLPFSILNGSPDDQYLGLAMADALVTKLGKVKSFRVRPTSAIRSFIDVQKDAVTIGRKLAVDAVIDGTIQKDGQQVRVTVQLINVADGTSLWTEKFDSRAGNVLALEDLVSQDVLAALSVNISSEENKRLRKESTDNDEAYRAYRLGNYFFDRSGVAGAVEKAINYYKEAIRLDPRFARAYAGLADAYSLDVAYAASPAARVEAHSRMEAAVLKALELDDQLAEAHTSLARLRFYDWDWASAEREYRRAIELDDNFATARFLYGWYLFVVGRMDEGLAQLYRAQEIDPLSVNINITIGACLTTMGEFDRAIDQLHKTIDLSPTSLWPHVRLAQAYELKGDVPHAEDEYRAAIKIDSASASDRVGAAELRMAQALAFWGRKSEALKTIERWTKGPDSGRASYDVAVIYAGLGQTDTAFQIWREVFKNRDMNLLYIRTDRRLAELRSDRRYVELMREVGLSPKIDLNNTD